MKLQKHEQDALANVARRLVMEFGAQSVVLYGSAARGEMDRESDIDLMVTLPSVTWEMEKRIGDIAFDAGLEIGRVISMICFSASELSDSPLRSSSFIHNVQTQGVPL